MDLQGARRRLNDIDRGAKTSIPPREPSGVLASVRDLIADLEDAMAPEDPEPTSPATSMEIGEVRRIGVDGHLIREDEGTWLSAESAFATEYAVGAAEAGRILRSQGDSQRPRPADRSGPRAGRRRGRRERIPMIDDDQLLEKRTRLRLENTAPQVGDYVVFPDGREERIAHDWGEPGVQTAVSGSFYLGDSYASFSGGLNPTIPTERLVDMGHTRPGSFWFFSGDYRGAHNGVDVQAPCRVYRYAGEAEDGS